MRTSFKQFISDANRRHSFQKKLISILCVLSVLVSAGVSMLLTMPGLTASLDPATTGGIVELLTDDPTHNGWVDYFGVTDSGYSTEFAGGVWMDKSVFTEYTSTRGVHLQADPGKMLVTLSAIGSSQSVTGQGHTPTDVMIILDLSSSMYNGSTKSPTALKAMVTAVNDSIKSLQALNEHNRVGVTIYYGYNNIDKQSTSKYGYVLMGLDRYKPASNGSYLTCNINSSNKVTSVRVTSGVTTEAGGSVQGTQGHSLPDIAGTYAQMGILHAMNQLTDPAKGTTVTINGEEIIRQPVFIFMSDGEPTAATDDYTNVGATADVGNNQVKTRSPNETDFLTQLTASYAKEQVKLHYNKQPLFYTLALGTSISLSVMDPSNNSTATIDSYWQKLVDNPSMTMSAKVFDTWGAWPDQKTITLKASQKTLKDGSTFPSSVDQRLYVDKYFNAATAGDLSNVFETIVNNINIKSMYTPTMVEMNNVNQSGEVSFVDYIGEYMQVTQMKGILIGGELYSGVNLSRNFVPGGVDTGMGSFTSPTDLGWAFHLNVMEQLGLDDIYNLEVDTLNQKVSDITHQKTTELIRDAYAAGQLAYTNDDVFSHYIGWYADSRNKYLGFWDGSESATPPEGATQVIKSYFFQGVTLEDDHYSMTTDMMYSTVWVKQDLNTGDETVVFSVPASLLPTLKYFIDLDENGNLTELTLGAPDKDAYSGIRPIRLVYEVGLQPDITPQTLTEKVDASYLASNTNAETGRVQFYSNEWERDQTTGYNLSNTYAYFRPSLVNDRYYYTVNSPLYYLDNGVYKAYTGDQPQHTDELFTRHTKYIKDANGSISHDYFYMPTADSAIDAAQYDENSKQWYIPVGNAHDLDIEGVNRFVVTKGNNVTGTLNLANEPFVDHTTNGAQTVAFVVGCTLGNNGRVAMSPDGQTLQKKLIDENGQPYLATMDQTFQFLIHEGEKLADYTDQAAVATALNGKKVSLLSLTVKQGMSESGKVALTGLTEYTWQNGAWHPKASETPTWNCLFTHTYTVVEIGSNLRFDLDNISGLPNVYQFQYGIFSAGETDRTIVANNRFVPWRIQLTKVDNQQTANRLPDAVFGLYSSDAADAMANVPEAHIQDATVSNGGTTWYLTQIGTTDTQGIITWEGLIREGYLILELESPGGYILPQDQSAQTVFRTSSDENRLLAITVSNVPGLELPSTGGSGSSMYIIIGSGLMLASLALMFVYHSKRKEDPVS